ncbi:MAG: TonB-dependent receptor [Chitinophagaceae bacterium]
MLLQKKKIILGITLSLLSLIVHAQYTQQLRGTVVDLVLQKPLAGATVTIPELNKSVITNEEGAFRFPGLAVGSYHLSISYAGFKEGSIDNIGINAGKETILTISLESNVRTENEVVLRANSKRNKPLNDMSAVSARAFTVEETQKYAAAVNDPLRMAVSFPGVMTADDGQNNIVIRGNSPTGLLWRMEGIDIPNPNHFSEAGGSGGGISILSSQLLANSDFVTGAFAAEYGNALSGVFDLKLRKGNNEKKEITLQAGLLGLNGAAEGPISAFYKGSYLVNYRYSTLELMNKLGINLGEGSTNFQDLSYNIYLPTKKIGEFTLFGFGGLSSEKIKGVKDSSKWKDIDDRTPSNYISNTGMAGVTHSISLGRNTTLKSAAALSITKNGFLEQYIDDNYSVNDLYKDSYKTKKLTLTSTMYHRFNNRHNIRVGAIANLIDFNYYRLSKDGIDQPLEEKINVKDKTQTVQGFTQWQYRITNDFTINTGVHYLRLLYNNKSSVEPRASMKWDISRKSSVAIGYGLHSQLQGLGVYFAQQENQAGSIEYPNKDLDFTKSHHFVVSYNYLLARNLRLRTEVYYQHLFNVPVSPDVNNTFSTLNVIDDYVVDALVNTGKGKNYGVEISLEKYLSNNYYFTVSNSIYESKYTAADGIERNTRFNGNYIANLTAGKEFINTKKSRTFGINIKTMYAGGYRNIPVDIEKSRQEGHIVLNLKDAYTLQNPAYFRTDLRVSMKWNRKHLTSTLSLDVQNLTNRLNVYSQYYDVGSERLINSYQTGIIPVLNYKIEF